MDVLRSGYAVPMRLVRDSDDTISIRWYKCADGADVFPGPHAFGSSIWNGDDYDYSTGLGEASSQREWRRSVLTTTPPGIEHHGPDEWFRDGIPAEGMDTTTLMCAGDVDVYSGIKLQCINFLFAPASYQSVVWENPDPDPSSYFDPLTPTLIRPGEDAYYLVTIAGVFSRQGLGNSTRSVELQVVGTDALIVPYWNDVRVNTVIGCGMSWVVRASNPFDVQVQATTSTGHAMFANLQLSVSRLGIPAP